MQKNGIVESHSLDALADCGVPHAAIAIGVFDGVHIGHQALLCQVRKMAERLGTPPVVMTFFPHPRQVLNAESAISLITTQRQKVKIIAESGIRAVVTVPFTNQFASLEPDQFIRECLVSPRVPILGIVVGTHWRFGRNGNGNGNLLEQFAAAGHFEFEAVDEIQIDGEPVSSTRIRRAISSGCLEHAETMLGRPFRLAGRVIHGKGIATRELRVPTANVLSYNGITPPNGVYAGHLLVDDQRFPAAIAVGLAPTFHFTETPKTKIEAHILDFTGDLYGRDVEIEFLRYLREERCYDSGEALRCQIRADLQAVRQILGLSPLPANRDERPEQS
jgi:riboflavin kinase/FMN adenylyltransferase